MIDLSTTRAQEQGELLPNQIELKPEMIRLESGVATLEEDLKNHKGLATLIDTQRNVKRNQYNVLQCINENLMAEKGQWLYNGGYDKDDKDPSDPTKALPEQFDSGTVADSSLLPTRIYFDLGKEYDISSFAFYTRNGAVNVDFQVDYGEPGNWTKFQNQDAKPVYNSWNERKVQNVKTRYIRVRSSHGPEVKGQAAYEFILFGTATGNTGKEPPKRNLIKVNKNKAYNVFGYARVGRASDQFDEQPTDTSMLDGKGLPNYVPKTSFTVRDIDGSQLDGVFDNSKTPKNQDEQDQKDNLKYVTVLDLEKEHSIEEITMYENMTSGLYNGTKLRLSYGKPSINGKGEAWTEIGTIDIKKKHRGWFHMNLKDKNIKTRYLRIAKSSSANISEFVLWGQPSDGIPNNIKDPEPIKPTKQVTMDKFMGMNGKHITSNTIFEAGGTFREYHKWHYNADREDGFKSIFSRGDITQMWGLYDGSKNFDGYFNSLNKLGIDTLITLENSTSKYYPDEDPEMQHKPGINTAQDTTPNFAGADRNDPASFIDHAEAMYNFGARYGSNKNITINDVVVSENESAKDLWGQNTVKYFENWNEPNSVWEARRKWFVASEFAAMTSGDYDGHRGTLKNAKGRKVGLKNADPNATFVLGGLAGNNIDYIKGMQFWYQNNRQDNIFPADVINMHQYQEKHYPEDTDFKEELVKTVDYVQRYLTTDGKPREVWLTEFGYDTYQGPFKPQSANQAPSLTAQSNWNIRTFLIASSAGISRAHMFMDVDPAVDNNEWSVGGDLTAGMARNAKMGNTRKPSYYSMYATKTALTDYVFDAVIEEKKNDVYVYRYRNIKNGRYTYAIWSPTNETKIGEKKGTYTLENIAAPFVTETRYNDYSTSGDTVVRNVTNNKVDVDVYEAPVFVEVYGNNEKYVEVPKTEVKPDAYSHEVYTTLSTEDPNVQIYYSTNGQDPVAQNPNRIFYTPGTKIKITKSTNIKTIGVKNGVTSKVAHYPYQIDTRLISSKEKEVNYNKGDIVTEAKFLKDIGAKLGAKVNEIAAGGIWKIESDFSSVVKLNTPGVYYVKAIANHYNSDNYNSDISSPLLVKVVVEGTQTNSTVTENYQTDLGAQIKAQTQTQIGADKKYTKNVPAITGYTYLGYRIGSGELIRKTTSPVTLTNIEEITYVYALTSTMSSISVKYQDAAGKPLVVGGTEIGPKIIKGSPQTEYNLFKMKEILPEIYNGEAGNLVNQGYFLTSDGTPTTVSGRFPASGTVLEVVFKFSGTLQMTVPSQVKFEDGHKVSNSKQTVLQAEDWQIQVRDRRTNDSLGLWSLSAKLSKSFVNGDGEQLAGQLQYKPTQAPATPMELNRPIVVHKHTKKESQTTVKWTKSAGFQMEVQASQAKAGNYKGEIMWELAIEP
ncbi:hypothetical protein XA3_14910 [Xylocopilactobacillus apicola]|uniref:F5/8 type C domain-containing protein n=2 Tax=Xylocopilactobacillus apicola TaxID=2932184 RepID=A0AAU9DBX5_9LACO|nr:hypothetical protein XA3_14910 [Xylocopilactobacillus apicola]